MGWPVPCHGRHFGKCVVSAELQCIQRDSVADGRLKCSSVLKTVGHTALVGHKKKIMDLD